MNDEHLPATISGIPILCLIGNYGKYKCFADCIKSSHAANVVTCIEVNALELPRTKKGLISRN